jgi:dehydrogenase/reductase SDR family protein 13
MKFTMITEEEGAKTTLICATDPSVQSESGYYYDNCRRIANSALADDAQLAATLWNESEGWVA